MWKPQITVIICERQEVESESSCDHKRQEVESKENFDQDSFFTTKGDQEKHGVKSEFNFDQNIHSVESKF